MDFDTYQEKSQATCLKNEGLEPLAYWALALNGEAGEVAEKIKKVFRDDRGKVTGQRKEVIKEELGDCLWYMAQVASDLDISLDDIAADNIEKILDRKKRGTLRGDGDDR